MRIVVLGGSGKIGGEVLKHLRRRLPDAELLATTRNPNPENSPNFQWLTFDPFQDNWEAVPKCEVLINCIGIIREKGKMTFEKVHEGLTATLLAKRAALGNPRIVQLSALGADPDHEVGFLRTKGRADKVLLEAPQTAVLRPSIVCTPDTMLVQKMRLLREIGRKMFGKLFVPKGFLETRIQPVLGEEVGEAVAEVALNSEREGTFELAGPEALAFRNLIDLLSQTGKVELKPLEVPREVLDSFVRYFVSVWFPGTINYDQFRLLFTDNISKKNDLAALLGHPPTPTHSFWMDSFATRGEIPQQAIPEMPHPTS